MYLGWALLFVLGILSGSTEKKNDVSVDRRLSESDGDEPPTSFGSRLLKHSVRYVYFYPATNRIRNILTEVTSNFALNIRNCK